VTQTENLVVGVAEEIERQKGKEKKGKHENTSVKKQEVKKQEEKRKKIDEKNLVKGKKEEQDEKRWCDFK
jgi:hypothetical protein